MMLWPVDHRASWCPLTGLAIAYITGMVQARSVNDVDTTAYTNTQCGLYTQKHTHTVALHFISFQCLEIRDVILWRSGGDIS